VGFNEYTGWTVPTRVFFTVYWCWLPFDFAVAIAAVNGFAGSWFERNLGAFAALGTYCGIHLTSCRTAAAEATARTAPFGFSSLTACRTPLWLVGVAFLLEEFLFLSSKGEGCPTIGTS